VEFSSVSRSGEVAHEERKIWQAAALLVKLYPAQAQDVVFALVQEDAKAGEHRRAAIWLRVVNAIDELRTEPAGTPLVGPYGPSLDLTV
jgi:hypothetical protein